jgi:Zinc-finger associated domain (zf-AD)
MSSKGYKAIAYHELCRLCAQSTSRHIGIFSKEGRSRQVARNIEKLLCINIKEVDPLPKTICSFCLSRVEDFREFHSSCLSASQFLHVKLPSVDKASGKCYVSVGVPVRPTFLKRKMSRLLAAPIESTHAASADKEADEEEVEVREYEECVQQPKPSEDYNADVFLKLLEDTMNTDCLLQDHDYLSIDELLGHDATKGKHMGKVMPVQDHDYLSSYENPMTPNVAHQELLDHNYFTSLGPFADNFVNLLSPEEEDKFIEHNYVLPSSATHNLGAEKPESEEMFEQCEQCGVIYAFYQSHECSADRQRQCEVCGDMFWTTLGFINHKCSTALVESQPSEVQCEVCGAIFGNLDHHDCLADFDRLCHRCGLVFHTFNEFDAHVCKTKIRLRCHFCAEKFAFKSNLRSHVLKHLGVKVKGPYICTFCGAAYRRRAFFKQHLQSKHCSQTDLTVDMNVFIKTTRASKIEYKCDQCAKKFSNNCNLMLHRQMHKFKHSCQVCHAKFLKQSDYCEHVMSHLSTREFPCDECTLRFDSTKQLQSHKIRHNANRKIKAVMHARKQLKIIG